MRHLRIRRIESQRNEALKTAGLVLLLAQANQMIRLLEALEDQDDVQNVYSNFDMDAKQMEEVAG